uniref:Uncharacterized protein n=1 Tax=Leersia perrieri TaxID=77586 RepID=A0A0D9XQA6_9ORYZ
MANDMKKMRVRLENITKMQKDFNFISESSSHVNDQEVLYGDRVTSPKVEEAAIIGRTHETRKIVADLSNKILTSDLIILAIHGMGGIGKTTLAQLVFNDKLFKDYCPVWVYVSQVFDLNKIESSIISQLSKTMPLITDLEMIPPNMNILIVLDDLWEKDDFRLDKLKLKLNVGKGAKVIVIVTTREEYIAKKFSNIEPYKLEALTDDMCWHIIKQKSDFVNRNDKEQLEQIGREIARKCGGVALAAQSLGYTLRFKSSDEWESVKEGIYGMNQPRKIHLHRIIMKPCLKMCFGYSAIFRKGQNIVKDDLIHQWISVGFIQQWQLGETYVNELLGMSFLHHSKSSSSTGMHDENVILLTMHDLVHDLARTVMVDEIMVSCKPEKSCDRSYRYALLSDSSKLLKSFTKFPTKIRAVRFVDCAKVHTHAFSDAKFLRVLDLSDCSVKKLPDSMCQLRQLRYLNAPGLQDKMFPDCITKLSKLVYLNLRGSSELQSLPESIGEMDSLMHFDLSGCSGIQRVPKSFGKLKLSYLNLSNCSRLKGVSEILRDLTKLQHLNLSYCQYVEELGNLGNLMELQYFHFSSSCSPGVSETDFFGAGTKLKYLNLSTVFTDIKIKRLPEAKGSFSKLNYLNLSGWRKLEELPRSWGNLQSLVHLDLSNCCMIKGLPEVLGRLTKLQYLNLSCCCCCNKEALKGIKNVMGKLTELRNLYLSGFLNNILSTNETIEDVCQIFFASLSLLHNLEELDLSNNFCIKTLPESIGNPSNLHTLNLSDSDNLLRLPNVMHEMDNLRHLNVSGCHLLDHSMVPMMDNNSIRLPQFVVQASDSKSSSNVILLQDVYPHELEISKLENVFTVEEAQRVRLQDKEMISRLTLNWTRDVTRYVEDQDLLHELKPPSKLQWFNLQGYSGVAFPSWLMDIVPSHFPCLTSIYLVDLPKCTFLPPLGQLPKLETLLLDRMSGITKIDGNFCGGDGAFRSLKNLSLSNMESLEEWVTIYYCDMWEGASEFMFPNLRILTIDHCPNLSLKPCPPKVDAWDIDRSDNVISSWPGADCASFSNVQVDKLTIKSCKLPMHRWTLFHHLSPLNSLEIVSCSYLRSSPEITQALSPLLGLSLKRNDFMPELPYWMGKLTSLSDLILSTRYLELNASPGVLRKLTSLRSLTLSECENLASLPKWLGDLPSLRQQNINEYPRLNNLEGIIDERLTNLERLDVRSCESITALPESLGKLTSLKKLYIRWCNGIESLPDSIHKLTNLVSLDVWGSPELEKWCELKENRTKLSHVL